MKKRILSLLLTLLAVLACTFPALAAGEDFTYAITVNGGASDTVKVGETVQVALTLTCNTDDTFNLYAMQDYVKFDPEYFSLDASSVSVYSTNVFWATAQDYGNGVDRVFVNHVSTTAVKLDKTVTVMIFDLKALKNGSTTITHEVTELSDGNGGQHSMEKKTASVTISNGSGGGSNTQTTTNPDGSTSTVVTKPDGSTTTTVKQPDGVTTVTNADKSGKPTGVTVTVPDTVKSDVPVSIPADLGQESGAVSAVVTYPDGTKETIVGNYSDGKIDLNVGGSATIEILDDFVPLASLPLTDVPSGAYYYDAVIWAAMNGITDGKTAHRFAPDDPCTRAETVTFLWRAMGSPEPTAAVCPFTDVDADAYYRKAVLWATEKGITKGTSATTFSPKDICTRAQVVTFQWRTAGSPAATAANPFTDVGSGLYYTDAVLWAVSGKITEGTTATTFSPAQACTRAQIVAFLWRQLGK